VLGGKSWEQWIEEYEQGHRHPFNRACHRIGIPLILLSLPLLVAGPFLHGLLLPGAVLFVLGWIAQFAGHVAERRPPEFFHDWRFLLVGARWWLRSVGIVRSAPRSPQ
jgi:uncharacterized membrane protein YGL010W